MTLPTLYAILDAESCSRRSFRLEEVAEAWQEAGIQLLQYRDKTATDVAYVANADRIKKVFQGTLIVNDRVHLLHQTGWHGVHIGQTDLTPSEARKLIGPDKILGLSTHTHDQVEQANSEAVDYIAIGPVFATISKQDADPTVGLEGVATARVLTQKPLVAIGGITQQTAQRVLHTGANSVAIISALLPPAGSSPDALLKSAQDFLAAFK